MIHSMRRILSMLLAILLTAGCGLALAEAEAAAPAGVLAMVNGRPVPLDDAQIEFSYYAEMYEAYGLADMIPTLREEVADFYVRRYVTLDAARQLGLDSFTDEELADFAAEAQNAYDEMLAEYQNYFAQDGKSEEEIQADTAAFLAENNYTLESVCESMRDSALIERFYAHATEGLTVSEEAVQALYGEQVAAQQANYDADPSAFEYDVMYGNDICYVPEGFRSVYHILLLLDETAQDELYQLQTRQREIAEALEAENADTEALNQENADIQARIDELCADLMARALEIRQRLDAGEDFLALMAEYGQDPGMQSEPFASKGYYVSADSGMWEPNFRDAAMALENVGDVSEPVLTAYGIHLILYSEELVPGAVPLETVREGLEAGALSALEEEAINDAIQAAMDAAEIVVYSENLTYTSAQAEEAVG